MRWLSMAVLLLGTSGVARAADCPFLTAAEAAQALLGPPAKVTFETVKVDGQGMRRARTCRFRAPGGGLGEVAVEVIDFASAADAAAAFRKRRADAGGKVLPVSGVGSAAYSATIPGFSASTVAQVGARLLVASHLFSAKVRQAIAESPDAEVLATDELAKLAVKRL